MKTCAYVTYQDIRNIKSLDEQTVIAIKAPPETRLEVPDPDKDIQIWLKSAKGPIEVYLCPEDTPDQLPQSSLQENISSSSSGEESLCSSEDSTSCDSFKSRPNLRNALIEDQDISPDLHTNLLQQTEDQDLDENFVPIEPPLALDDFMFGLEEGEGISDLFDNYSFDLKI
ncbi:hypothetical protein ACJMK2_003923 [Sinanodonta woodiana]|uniref:E2F transcription factor CC-MB domain-containing protein n=1 Tax=Sinanodonta woodiana TaxID=1069815 RepID=A0ABD3Y190_SINWO